MKTQIGAFDAKTKLPELLRAVKAGKQFTITHRGTPIADLVPAQAQQPKASADAVDKFLAFMKAHPVRIKVDIQELLEEGRE